MRRVVPLDAPPAGVVVTVPGGRSLTNRALVAAALAPGRSTLRGIGRSDDTEAMVDCLTTLGAVVADAGPEAADLVVTGVAGRPRSGVEVFTRLSGTTSRFVTAVAALGDGPVRVDAAPPMRRRPMADLVDALRALGVTVEEEGEPGHLPLTVTGPIAGDRVEVPGTVSSQYLSGLLLAGGARSGPLSITVNTDRLVSQPYVTMTRHVMAAFGVPVEVDGTTFRTAGGGYRPTDHTVAADAATAGYLLAAAAITGGTVSVPSLPSAELQADAEVVDVMEAMGCRVDRAGDGTVTVTGPPDGRLRGGSTFDLTAFSDMAPTVAVLAAFADGPTAVTGVGFIRGKETDRIAASVAELRRVGVPAEETDDGFVVRPDGPPRGPATIETYDDHRMAMAFALVGLVVPGISVADPGVVAKTHPGYWDDLDHLRS